MTENAIRHTTLSPAEERGALDEATRLGFLDAAGNLTERGRNGAAGLLSAL